MVLPRYFDFSDVFHMSVEVYCDEVCGRYSIGRWS